MSDPAVPPRRHLFIAGTGRAGTSFLVRFLDGMGLETHLARHDSPYWVEAANAGLEDLPLGTRAADLPYVVKTPWLGAFVAEVLGNPAIAIDAVILPVRDLADAAASRVVGERSAIHAAGDWMTELAEPIETWGTTPGGVVYSLNPLDQGRLLAVWFHHLVQNLVRADIPMVFLDFPRLAADPDYLFARLAPWLPAGARLDRARAVHAALADPAKVRIAAERAAAVPEAIRPGVRYDDAATLDRMARGRAAGTPTPDARAAPAPAADLAALQRQIEALQTDLAWARADAEAVTARAQVEVAQAQAEAAMAARLVAPRRTLSERAAGFIRTVLGG